MTKLIIYYIHSNFDSTTLYEYKNMRWYEHKHYSYVGIISYPTCEQKKKKKKKKYEIIFLLV